jgi:hypothetical protein
MGAGEEVGIVTVGGGRTKRGWCGEVDAVMQVCVRGKCNGLWGVYAGMCKRQMKLCAGGV